MNAPSRPRAVSLLLDGALLLAITALLLIYLQPTPTAGIARLRAELRYDCRFTEEVARTSLVKGLDLLNPAQQENFQLLSDQFCYFGRSDGRYAAIVTERYRGQRQWNAAPSVYLIDPVPELPVTTNLYLEAEGLALPADHSYVFGVIRDPDITRVRLTYGGLHHDVYTIETTEFHDGMFLLCPGVRSPSDYTFTAYDRQGNLIYRDACWYTGRQPLRETYIRT